MRRLTPKQEAFCRAYIETGNASEAYRRAYKADRMKPETVHRKAVEVLENGKVAARIEALRAEHRRRHAITVDRLTHDALAAYALARQTGNPSAMVRALEFLAKLHGLAVERHEVRQEVRVLGFEVVAEVPCGGGEA